MRVSPIAAPMLAVLLLASVPASAGPQGSRVPGVLAGKAGKGLRMSAAVWDATTGALLHESNSAEALRPASVMKLATTAAAFLALGPTHELTTEASVASQPRGGVVEGDLTVTGHGDPGFSAHCDPRGAEAVVADFARQVRAAGIVRVAGDLVIDGSAYTGPERHPGWNWSDGSWGWDRAPVTAVVLNDNCVDLVMRPGVGVGAPVTLITRPQTGAVRFLNRLSTSALKTKQNARIGTTQSDGSILLAGTVAAGFDLTSPDLACARSVRGNSRAMKPPIAPRWIGLAPYSVLWADAASRSMWATSSMS